MDNDDTRFTVRLFVFKFSGFDKQPVSLYFLAGIPF
jgi:hypothetical protein